MSLTSQNVISELLKALPEFQPAFDDLDFGWNELPYVVFGRLSRYLSELLRAPKNKRELLQRAFSFLEDLATSRDADIQALLMCGLLEVLGDDGAVLREAHNWMGKVTRKLSDETERFWGRSMPR